MRVQFYSRVTPRRSFVVVAAAAHYGLKKCWARRRLFAWKSSCRCPLSFVRSPLAIVRSSPPHSRPVGDNTWSRSLGSKQLCSPLRPLDSQRWHLIMVVCPSPVRMRDVFLPSPMAHFFFPLLLHLFFCAGKTSATRIIFMCHWGPISVCDLYTCISFAIENIRLCTFH